MARSCLCPFYAAAVRQRRQDGRHNQGDPMTTVFSASLLFMTMLASGSDDPGKSIVLAQENTSALQAASAQSDADRIRQRVKEGQKVRITDDQGREWHGRIDTLTPDNLTVVTHDRQRTDLPYGTILRIDRPHDSLANGALIGLASGAAFGLSLVIDEEHDCEPWRLLWLRRPHCGSLRCRTLGVWRPRSRDRRWD